MRLTVWHDPIIPAPKCPGVDEFSRYDDPPDLEKQDTSNHGLFVTSLAYAVAPEADFYLVRVLEDDGCGSLITIEKGIQRFLSETMQEQRTLTNTVLNLSLGVHMPPDPDLFALPSVVESFSQTLNSAIRAGAVVVAAGGNDSYASPEPVGMEIPAQNPGVIGVAASSKGRTRGCFSNADWSRSADKVAAPGGDGVPGWIYYSPTDFEYSTCTVPKCSGDLREPCLIGLVSKYRLGYAYWVGTSFAAPLVSGQQALLLEAETARIALSPTRTCSAVGSHLDNGIIDLLAPTAGCRPTPTPTPP